MTHAQRQVDVPEWLRMFDEQSHPRAPKGSDTGGQFAKSGAGNSSAKPQAKKPGGKPASRPQAAKRKPAPKDDGTLSYDAGSNQGTGYSSANGDPRVHRLQQALNRLGMTDSTGKALKDDGKLGPKTTSAVKKLQKRLGLPQDGKVSPALLEKIAGLKSLPRRSGVLDLCVRSFGFEFEQRAKGDGRTLEGYAAVFNVPAKIRDVGGDFEETILPGAFKRSLGERMPILQWDHGKDPRVGTVPIGSFVNLAEDSNGLHVRARLFDNDVVEPVRQAIEARAIRGMSFRFGVPDGGDDWPSRDQRHVRDADVHELGPVAFPAYDATSVSVRDLLAGMDATQIRSLFRELAEYLDADPIDLTGQSDARSDDGGDPGAEPDPAPTAPQLTLRQRLDEGALRARGILL